MGFTTEVTSSRGSSEENGDLGLVLHSPVLQWMHHSSIDVPLRSYPRQPLSLSTLKEPKRPVYHVLITPSLLQMRFTVQGVSPEDLFCLRVHIGTVEVP